MEQSNNISSYSKYVFINWWLILWLDFTKSTKRGFQSWELDLSLKYSIWYFAAASYTRCTNIGRPLSQLTCLLDTPHAACNSGPCAVGIYMSYGEGVHERLSGSREENIASERVFVHPLNQKSKPSCWSEPQSSGQVSSWRIWIEEPNHTFDLEL